MANSESIDIQASPDQILSVLLDVDSYPIWSREVKQAHVLQKDEQGRPLRAQMQVDAFVKILNYVVEFKYAPEEMSWHMLSGNMKKNEGLYRLTTTGNATHLIYTYDQDPGVPFVPRMFIQMGIKQGATQLLEDIKKRVTGQ